MKKFLAIISLVLIVCMLVVTPAFAEEETPVYEKDFGQDVFHATKLSKEPRLDGNISEEEWGEPTVVKVDPNYWQSLRTDDTYANVTEEDPGDLDDRTIEELKVWFAYDDTKIYIAYEQLGGVWDCNNNGVEGDRYDEYTFRHNNVMRLGFDIENFSNLLQIDYGSEWTLNKGTSSLNSANLRFTNGMAYAEDASAIKPSGKSPLSGGMIKKVHAKDGSPLAITNSQNGQYIETIELAFNKDRLLAAVNEAGETDYAELPNAMYFGLYFRQYSWGDEQLSQVVYNGQTAWFGTPIDLSTQLELDTLFQYYPDIVVFGDKIEKPLHESDVTEAPAETSTEAATDAPESTPAADETKPVADESAPTSEVPTVGATEGGCGGTVSFAGLALIATLGTLGVIDVTKKKRS